MSLYNTKLKEFSLVFWVLRLSFQHLNIQSNSFGYGYRVCGYRANEKGLSQLAVTIYSKLHRILMIQLPVIIDILLVAVNY